MTQECRHEGYCSLNQTVCKETDFPEHCLMRETDIEELPLLKEVKERLERDREREADQNR